MKVEWVHCDAPGCEENMPTREAYDWMKVSVQVPGKKFWADLCSKDCAVRFFREGGLGGTEGIEAEGEV